MRCCVPVWVMCCVLAGLASAQDVRPIPISIEADSKGEPFEEPDARKAIAAIVSDAQHQAWAIFRSQGARLAVFQKDHWAPLKLPGFPPTLKALKLARLKDGAIACLWRDEATAEAHVLSRHTTKQHQLLARIPIKLTEPRLLPLADGGLLVTAAGRELLRIGKGGADPEIITLPEDAFLPPKKNDDGSSRTGFVPVHAVQDQRGTIWLWSHAMQPMEWEWRLRGLGRITPQGFTFQDIPGTKPEQPISVVTPWMGNRLAIAVAGVGLFDLDVEKRAMTAFAAPGDELKYIEKIFPAGDDWHLITTPRPTEQKVSVSKTFNAQLKLTTERFYDPQKRTSALFRLRGSELAPLTWKLDGEPAFGWPDRPVIETKEGFWTCVKGGGLVFVPFAAKGVLKTLDWRNGLTLREPVEMARAGDTQFVVLDRNSGQTCLLPLKPGAVNPAAVRVEILRTESLLLEDASGRIWGRLADDTFQRWENGRWNKLEVPEKVAQMSRNVFIADAHEQGWLIPMKDGPAAVCDFKTGEWHVFASIEAALVARMQPASKLLLRDFPSLAPVSSAVSPCRIGFLREAGTLHHFDGHEWRTWKVADLAGPDARVTSPPRFDQDGRFTLAISGYDWKLMPDGQWRRTEQKADVAERIYHSEEAQPPHDCPVKNVSSTAYDRHGVCWLSDAQRRLWKCIPGCAVPVLQSGEPNPLLEGAHLYEVRSDLIGNAFLRLQFGWHGERYLAVRSRLPQPESKVTLHEVVADTARIEFGEAAWHMWRFGNGAWSLASDKKEHVFTGLLPGVQELEIMAYNADLTPASASAKVKLTIKAADITELETLIRLFNGDDLDTSEAAARRLRSQGKAILPSLNRTRENADERTRWWLDAIIQQIEAKHGSK